MSDVDFVLDLVGDGPDGTTSRSVDVLVSGGTLISVAPGQSSDVTARAERAGVRVTAAMLVEPDGEGLTRIAELVDAGAIAVAVEEVFPLAQVARAHARGEMGTTSGKLVLKVI